MRPRRAAALIARPLNASVRHRSMQSPQRMSSLRLPRWWVFSIIAAEFLLAALEALIAYRCHHFGGECWEFFFTSVVNLPVSEVLSDLVGNLSRLLGIAPFSDSLTLITATVYALGGTLWWIAISILAKAAWVALTSSRRRSEKGGGGDV